MLLPTIRKEGSEVWLSLNPDMETDETYQRFVSNPPPDAVVVQMNWRDNPWFPEVLEKERQETLRRDQSNYENIWEGKPKLVSEGAIYKEEIERLVSESRIRLVPYDPVLSVHTVWDLGWNDAMTIGFFQRSGAEVRCIDYIEIRTERSIGTWRKSIKRPWRWGQTSSLTTVEAGISRPARAQKRLCRRCSAMLWCYLLLILKKA